MFPSASIALGTSRTAHNILVTALKHGVKCGVRVIDTAVLYNNDGPVRKAIQESLTDGTVKRDELCIINKTFYTTYTANEIEEECRTSLKELDLDYIDLYLIHYPFLLAKGCKLTDAKITFIEDNLRTRWSGMEKLVEMNLVKHIGVSNFSCDHINEILSFCSIKPCLNQIECHPYFPNQALLDHCISHDIQVMAFGPLGSPTFLVDKDDPQTGHMTIMKEKDVVKIAEKYSKTPAQILLKWAVQRGTIPVVKTTNCQHIEENVNIVDFVMSTEEMEEINGLARTDGRVWTFDFARES